MTRTKQIGTFSGDTFFTQTNTIICECLHWKLKNNMSDFYDDWQELAFITV